MDKTVLNRRVDESELNSEQPRYSVIIPIYNAEKTLRRCLDSLLTEGEPYSAAEIILVNDGSTDASASICEEYSERFDNIRVIEKTNGGVSSARNKGLEEARGYYILFVDSDDYVTTNFFSVLDEMVETEPADFVQFSFCIEKGNRKRRFIQKIMHLRSREEMVPTIVNAICRKSINGPWGKLFRRDIIEEHHIRFPAGVSIGEDRAFNSVYSFYCSSYRASKRIVYITNTDNKDSLSRKRHSDLKQQLKLVDEYIEHELMSSSIADNEKECYRQALNFGICTDIYHDAKLLIQDRVGWFSRQKQLMQRCKKINGMHMEYPKTRYCTLITLPVRLCLTPAIDAAGRKLAREASSPEDK